MVRRAQAYFTQRNLHDMQQHKDGCRKREQCLYRITEPLNYVTTIGLKVDQRALRDKIKLLQLYVTKRNKEECSSGISPEHTELYDLLQEICERKKESEATYHQQSSEKANQIYKEKEAAEDTRTKSLETLSETPKRAAQDSVSSCSSHNEKRR